MIPPLLHHVKFKSKLDKSPSIFVNIQQIHVRNLLLFCFGLAMSRQIFGDNIVCHIMRQAVSQSYVDNTCFINGTLSKNGNLNYNYYQWVSLYFVWLAFCFYLPFSIWSKWCGFYIQQLTTNVDDTIQQCQIKSLIQRSNGNSIFWKTFALEMAYVIHLGIQLEITDVFFNRAWSQGKWSWNAIPNIFPDEGRCFIEFVSGGDVTMGKFICLLPLCSVYRKIFYLLYIVVVGLLIYSFLVFAYRLALFGKYKDHINRYYAYGIAKNAAKTWQGRDQLMTPQDSGIFMSNEDLSH